MNVASLLILLANLGVLALNVKLYTEILKDGAFNRRAKGRLPEEDRDA
jgi:hypothetical protein